MSDTIARAMAATAQRIVETKDVQNDYFNFISGCSMIAQSTPNLSVNLASGKYRNIPIAKQVIAIEALAANASKSWNNVTLTTSSTQVLGDHACYAMYPTSIVVKDHTTQAVLELGTDYDLHDMTASVKYIHSIGGNKTVDITFSAPICRIDSIWANKSTGVVTVKKGYESNNNPTFTLQLGNPANSVRLGYVFLRWNETTIQTAGIYNCSSLSMEGFTQTELLMVAARKKEYRDKLFDLYYNMVRMMDTWTSVLSRRTDPIKIGFIGDSTIEQLQPELSYSSQYYGWTMILADLLHTKYPNAEIKYYRVGSDTPTWALVEYRSYAAQNSSPLKIHLYNYAKSSHHFFSILHDGASHYDKNLASCYSPLYANGVATYHDLFFICRCNMSITTTTKLRNRSNHSNPTYQATFGTSGLYLYDIMTAAPYSCTLRAQTDYDDATYGPLYLYQDTKICYKAIVKRMIDDMKAQGSDVILVSSTPDNPQSSTGSTYFNQSSEIEESKIVHGLAKDYNLLFFDLWHLYRNPLTYTGLDMVSLGIPGGIHPSMYMQYIIANRIGEALTLLENG